MPDHLGGARLSAEVCGAYMQRILPSGDDASFDFIRELNEL